MLLHQARLGVSARRCRTTPTQELQGGVSRSRGSESRPPDIDLTLGSEGRVLDTFRGPHSVSEGLAGPRALRDELRCRNNAMRAVVALLGRD